MDKCKDCKYLEAVEEASKLLPEKKKDIECEHGLAAMCNRGHNRAIDLCKLVVTKLLLEIKELENEK